MLHRTIAKFLFYAVTIVLLAWTSSLTYSFLSMALPGTLPVRELARRLADADAAVGPGNDGGSVTHAPHGIGNNKILFPADVGAGIVHDSFDGAGAESGHWRYSKMVP